MKKIKGGSTNKKKHVQHFSEGGKALKRAAASLRSSVKPCVARSRARIESLYKK
jgi:hypothetical protein